MPPLLARLYALRGIQSSQELDYELKSLIPPSALKNASAAASLLADAIEAQARMIIVADYDCDGATACAVAIRSLRKMIGETGAVVDYIVPNRFEYGYGLSPEIVDLAATRNPDLIITVDNGIASIAGVQRATELGIATLITDHHLPGDKLPEAECIVNPNQPDCDFPSKCIAGVGVIFYVMLALRAELRSRQWFGTETNIPEPNLALLLDIVALGTVADVVKLDHNNRTLVHNGLRRIREGKLTPGIRALFTAAGKRPESATSLDLGFLIGPRLNAAGRLSDMTLGIEALITDDEVRALQIAQALDKLNRERKEIEQEMQSQAAFSLEVTNIDDTAAISLFNPEWHQGVIGILASRIKERNHRPTFAFAPADPNKPEGELRGSGRSIPGFHLRDALDMISKQSPTLLKRFGGHAMAAGVTIAATDFAEFKIRFEQIAKELLSSSDLELQIETDGELETSHISIPTIQLLEQEIWGQGFPAPLFEDVFIVETQRVLKEKHLKLRLRKGNSQLDAIQFNFTLTPGRKIRVAFRLSINDYNGSQSPQLLVEHLENIDA